MRVMLAIAEMATGGAERVVAELARALRDGDHQVAVAAGRGPFDGLLDPGVERYEFAGRGRSPVRLLGAVGSVRRAITDFSPELIHIHNVKATGIVALARASQRSRPPLLATFHGVPPGEYAGAARILRAAKLVACVSQDLADGLAERGFPAGRLRVVPNAVAPPPPPLAPADRAALDAELGIGDGPVITIVGRLVAQKAHERFIETARLVSAEIPDAVFLVVGDGPRRSELEALAAAAGLVDRMRFTGVRDDVGALIGRSTLVAFSSDWEGMPMVALEALAAGVPVVSTDVEGMRELLHDDAGVIVPRSAEALAEGILSLLRSPERLRELGEAGRRRVGESHSPDAMVAAYVSLYGALLGR
jgi:glycosyltransferase involved in cell wall biosynthesis